MIIYKPENEMDWFEKLARYYMKGKPSFLLYTFLGGPIGWIFYFAKCSKIKEQERLETNAISLMTPSELVAYKIKRQKDYYTELKKQQNGLKFRFLFACSIAFIIILFQM